MQESLWAVPECEFVIQYEYTLLLFMGVILPFYGLIDMLETALNVWSDACVTKVVSDKAEAGEPVKIKTKQRSLMGVELG